MIVRITEKSTQGYKDMQLGYAMLLFGLSPRNALALDQGLELEDARYSYKALTRLN